MILTDLVQPIKAGIRKADLQHTLDIGACGADRINRALAEINAKASRYNRAQKWLFELSEDLRAESYRNF